MSKIITFARTFPKGHPKEGKGTFFVEQTLNGLGYTKEWYYTKLIDLNRHKVKAGKLTYEDIESFFISLQLHDGKKYHTIRASDRFKMGEMFTPAVWSGRPYHSPQIIFWDDLIIKSLQDVDMFPTNEVYIDKKYYGSIGSEKYATLAMNDGLSARDMQHWFKLPFSGKIINWSNFTY